MEKRKHLTSFDLKIIAIISMFIHIGVLSLNWQQLYLKYVSADVADSLWLMPIMDFLELTGKIAFPIFAFCISEGVKHTSNIKKYFLRLFIFAAISEIPYELALHNGFLNHFPRFMDNVFFTLLLGAIACALYSFFKDKKHFPVPICALPVLPLILFAEYMGTDYAGPGVLLIFVAYIMPNKKAKLIGISAMLAFLYLIYWNMITSSYLFSPKSVWQFLFALIAVILIGFYNGERGKPIKWFFYIFYPATLLLFYGLNLLLL